MSDEDDGTMMRGFINLEFTNEHVRLTIVRAERAGNGPRETEIGD
jgi:hypothetical protein